MDINLFAKFDESPSLPVQIIKEKSKCCGFTKGNSRDRQPLGDKIMMSTEIPYHFANLLPF